MEGLPQETDVICERTTMNLGSSGGPTLRALKEANTRQTRALSNVNSFFQVRLKRPAAKAPTSNAEATPLPYAEEWHEYRRNGLCSSNYHNLPPRHSVLGARSIFKIVTDSLTPD